MINVDNDKIEELLSRGVEDVIDRDKLKEKLKSGVELRIKLGIDPTSPNIHIGRGVALFKLRDFQLLGHKVVLIIGDFTGVIGDTSDKESERPMLKAEQVKQYMENYILQAGKILDISKCEIHYNSEWLSKISYAELGTQADVFSLSDFISRENIKLRLEAGKRVSLRELLYPLMQGYDSVAIKADVELGGSDQRFNLLVGRDLQRLYKQQPQDIITNSLIEGLDGRKMSSSWGNVVNLCDLPNDMYGKIMSLKDEFIIKYFTLTTRIDLVIVDTYKKELEGGANPKIYKMKLAHELVRFYHSEEDAIKAEEYFNSTFGKKEIPTDLKEVKPIDYNIIATLIEVGFATSKGDARRAIEQGGVKIDGETVKDVNFTISPNVVLQKGKMHFVKII